MMDGLVNAALKEKRPADDSRRGAVLKKLGDVAELEAWHGAQHPICNRENVGSSPTVLTT
jgi:hypothetical protein